MTLKFRDKLMGGIPQDPKVIEGWLRSKAGITNDEEIRQATMRTLIELGVDVTPEMTYEQMVTASEELASTKSTNGFKRDDDGLYIEGRQVKAAIKESVNILYAGVRWGKTKKGPKSYTAERVHILEDCIHVDRTEPDGVELVIGHVSGPQGQRSTLTHHQYIDRPEISFTTMQMDGSGDLSENEWARVWVSMQEQGIGALRSQGHGRFDVIAYEEARPEVATAEAAG